MGWGSDQAAPGGVRDPVQVRVMQGAGAAGGTAGLEQTAVDPTDSHRGIADPTDISQQHESPAVMYLCRSLLGSRGLAAP